MTDNQYNTLLDIRRDFDCLSDSPQSLSRRVREFLTDYVSDNCAHPRKLCVRDSFTNEPRILFVPCGRCAVCRDRKQGDWSARMILQTLYCSKYAYFITLTYRSFDIFDDIPPVLRDAYYRYDDYNEYHRATYSPCLLRIEHVQRFMKYLRKLHGDDSITFYDGSEYGSTYGRPHHHLVLWSNTPISRADVVRAWSCRLPKSKRVIHIGRIDYNDLNANGSIICDGRNFGNDLHHCFHYVTKYVTKSYINPNDQVDARSRLNLFIDDLSHERISAVIVNKIFNRRIKSLCALYSDWASFFADYCRENEYLARAYYDPFVQLNKRIYYDYETSDLSYCHLYSEDDNEIITQAETRVLSQAWYGQIKPLVLRKVFNCFCNSSRAEGIGMAYYRLHADEYKSGKFNLPTYNGKKIVLPRLFIRKTKEVLIRYIQESKRIVTPSAKARLLVNSRVFKSCFPQFDSVDFLSSPYDSLQRRNGIGTPHHNGDCTQVPSSIFLPEYNIGVACDIQCLVRSIYSFRDYSDNTRCLAFLDTDYSAVIRKYRYNRSSRTYEFIKQVPFAKFVASVYDAYMLYTPYYNLLREHSELSRLQLDTLYEDLSLYCDHLFDIDCSPDSLLEQAHQQLCEKLRNVDNYKQIKITQIKSL